MKTTIDYGSATTKRLSSDFLEGKRLWTWISLATIW